MRGKEKIEHWIAKLWIWNFGLLFNLFSIYFDPVVANSTFRYSIKLLVLSEGTGQKNG